MTQQIINVGPAPNDGQGDPIRTAYIKCNDNFSQLYSRAQSSPPPTLVGTIGDEAGMYAYDSTYFYYCFSNYNGVSEVWAQVTQVANISISAINDGTSNVQLVGTNGNATININGTSNVAVFNSAGANISGYLTVSSSVTGGNILTGGLVSATGNISGSYILGNGSQLTGLPSTYGNVEVQEYLPFYTGTLSPSGIFTDSYNYANGTPVSFSGNGGGTYGNAQVASYLPTYTGDLGGTLTTATQPNITSLGTLTGLNVTGLGSVVINPIASNVTISPVFGGTVVVNPSSPGTIDNMVIGSSTPQSGSFIDLTSSGNISGTYFIGDGSQLTNLPASNYSNANVAAYLPTYTGNLSAGNILVDQEVSVTGNITGSYFIGDGSQLTNLPASNYSNANVAAYLPTYTGNISAGNISISGTVTGSLIGNVTGTVNGQLNGLVNGVNTVYGEWDFGWINTNTYTNPIQWIFAQTSAGNVDMGTITAPASYEIDIGTIF